jgi:hypothetical protein
MRIGTIVIAQNYHTGGFQLAEGSFYFVLADTQTAQTGNDLGHEARLLGTLAQQFHNRLFDAVARDFGLLVHLAFAIM